MTAKPIKSEPLKTVLVIVLGMMVIYLVNKSKWALLAALLIGVLGVSSPFLAKKIDFLWMKLAWILSLIVPNILLTIIFYFFLTPIALLSRLSQKNSLYLKNTESSMFKDTTTKIEKSSFEKSW